MEVYYIEAGIFEEMLARTESLSAQADRLYEKNREKKPEEWMDYQDVWLGILPNPAENLLQAGGRRKADGLCRHETQGKGGERKKKEWIINRK